MGWIVTPVVWDEVVTPVVWDEVVTPVVWDEVVTPVVWDEFILSEGFMHRTLFLMMVLN